jgi:hypothetical protein
MGKNNQQKQAEARAAKAAPITNTQPTAEQPKPPAAPSPAASPTPAAQPTKQDATIAKLKEAWTAKGVDLNKLSIRDDGKFKLVVVTPEWPTISIGPTGGISVLELRSYAKAFDAAVDGLALYDKQQARDAKKQTATAPIPPKAAAPEAPKPTTTARKRQQHEHVEQQLQAQA